MTQHFADQEKYISVEGIDNATEVAAVLLKNGYEVMIELDDCNIYCVHYAEAKYKHFGNPTFYRITDEDIGVLEAARYAEEAEKTIE